MRKIFILFICTLGILQFKTQDKIDAAIKNLEQNYSQEKVYLLLDKDQYVVGDNLFFKSYVFDGYRRSNISGTLYVELYDRNKNLIDKRTIALKNGEGDGTFALTDALKEDVYFLRAYTRWMSNFPESFNWLKAVPVYNPKSEQRLVLTPNNKWSAKLFPEGGHFIDAISTKMAVRLYAEGIAPAKWSGYVIDNEKPTEKLAKFVSLDQNVATFDLTPKIGKNYKLIVEDDKGNKQTVAFPKVEDKGVAIKLSSDDQGIHYNLMTKNIPQGLKDYSIVGIINNQLVYRANIKKESPEVTSNIPNKVSDNTNAVLQLILFDDKQQVVAKRLCFILPNKLGIIQPTFSDTSLNNTPRAFNSLDIEPDPDFSSYAVLVKEPSANDNDNSILSALWLTGDFTSPITAPAQYFSKNAKAEALDALLISEDWKRFDWDDVLSGKTPEIKVAPETSLSFKGRVTNDGIIVPNKSINLMFGTNETEKHFAQTSTDNDGYIYLNNMSFDKPLTVSYFLNQDKDKNPQKENLKISFQPSTPNTLYKSDLPSTNYKLVETSKTTSVNTEVAKALQNRKNQEILKAANEETLIKEVQIVAKKVDKKAELDKELSTARFSSMNSTVFDLVNENEDAKSYFNILQWLQGRVAGLTFQMDGSGNYIPTMRGSKTSLYLDEVPMDASMINSVPVSDIAMVKVLKDGGLISNAIAIYTKRGSMLDNNTDKKEATNKSILRGYDKATEFEQPDITSDAYKKISQDTRQLLYWNPDLVQDSSMPSRVIFFNNDNAQKREITIISFDKNDKILFYNDVK